MDPFIVYIIKVSVALAVFYLFYLLAFQSTTLYRLNRYYLILSLLLSFILPFVHFSFSEELTGEGVSRMLEGVSIVAGKAAQSSFGGREGIVSFIGLPYLIISLVSVLLLLVKIIRIFVIRYGSEPIMVDNRRVYLVKAPVGSFSFGRWIFIDKLTCMSDQKHLVLRHELAHVEQGHTFDLMLSGILCSLFWFHPVVWMYRKSLYQVHEFLADDAVIKEGFEPGNYMQIIYNQMVKIQSITVSSHFSHSLIKRRFVMITKARSGKMSAVFSYSSIPLIIVVCFLLVNILEFPAQAQKGQKYFAPVQVPDKDGKVKNKKQEEKVYKKIDQVAEYPGGIEALQQYIAKEIHYPELAKSWGINSKVYVNFVVSSEGKIGIVKILKSKPSYADEKAKKASAEEYKKAVEAMDKEAVRVVGSLPGTWTPAKAEGKNVASEFTVPISFKLK